MTPRRLLVPVDTTPECDAALAVAAGLARALRGTLTLLEVVPIALPSSYGTGEREQRHLDQLGKEHVDELAGRVGDGVDVRTALSWGPDGPAVVEQAASGEHDAVVVGWPMRGALGHLMHDRAARHVLDHCPIPVLVVPAAER